MVNCGICGEANAARARFCSACGASLDAVAGREVRKTVSVVFADVTGSTALGEQIDPESFRRVMARYFETASGCLERHGGSVEKFIGDAVMAVFGVPTVHEDDALRALRAADELRNSMPALNDELESYYGVKLELRIGVNTGQVVTGTQERLATGDAVNVAARLEQAANPTEILIGEKTMQLARGAIEVEPVAPLTLKGKQEPVRAYRLLRVIEGASAFEQWHDAPLVGRRHERAILLTAFESAVAERRCRLVTVLGPPGIGKSRLARELESTVHGQAAVLVGRCLPYGEGITYQPLVEIFRQAGDDEDLAAALAAGAPEEVFWSIRKSLERRARAHPLAVVVEDIHWAEPVLLDLIDHLASWTRDAPMLLICTARPELRDKLPAWAGELITLEPLTEAESDELIEQRLDGSRLEPPVRARITAAAEGNPLFVEQLLAMAAQGGDPADVPPTIQALLAARIDSLPEPEREVLERASVIGPEFDWEALAQLTPDHRRPAGALLSALARKELIRPHEATEDVFQFRHMLIRDAAYDRISRLVRADLHERLAAWLDAGGAALEENVGYHAEQAYRSLVLLGPVDERGRRLAEWAADRLSASAGRANGRGDVVAAANLLDRASSLLPADDPHRLRLLPALGRALRDAGRMDRAEQVLSEAANSVPVAQEVFTTDATVSLTDLLFQRKRIPRQEAMRRADDAVRVLESGGDEASLARALTLRGNLLLWAGGAAAAVQELQRAARHARNAGDHAQEAEILQRESLVHVFGPTPVVDALARLEEMRRRGTGSGRLERSLMENAAQLEAMRGNFSIAGDLIARARAIASDRGLGGLEESRLAAATANVALLAGDLTAAERELRPACDLLESIGELGYLATTAVLLVETLYRQGRYEEASGLAERWRPERLTVPEDVAAQAAWRGVQAKLLARRGDAREAEELAREAVAIAARSDMVELQALVSADLGHVLRLTGHPEEAAAATDAAIRLYEQKGMVVAAAMLQGGPSALTE